MTNIKVKWPKVHLLGHEPIYRWIDLCNVTMFRIAAFFTGCHDGLVVGIERHSVYGFKWPSEPLAFGYVCEKLDLCEADGRNLTDWINVQFGFDDVPQQGNYYLKCLQGIEPYWIAGEKPAMPLFPMLVEEIANVD